MQDSSISIRIRYHMAPSPVLQTLVFPKSAKKAPQASYNPIYTDNMEQKALSSNPYMSLPTYNVAVGWRYYQIQNLHQKGASLFHCNETMKLLSDAGFESDSSAIPRPHYKWEETYKDWTITPSVPYYPCKSDYRKPGEPSLPILEIPMSVIQVRAPYDTEYVLRYLNLAYHPSLFEAPLRAWLSRYSHLITVTHPYELAGGRQHGLLSFNIEAFIENILKIKEVADQKDYMVNFLTISEFASRWKGGANGKQKS